jgi:hypothetical protein
MPAMADPWTTSFAVSALVWRTARADVPTTRAMILVPEAHTAVGEKVANQPLQRSEPTEKLDHFEGGGDDPLVSDIQAGEIDILFIGPRSRATRPLAPGREQRDSRFVARCSSASP